MLSTVEPEHPARQRRQAPVRVSIVLIMVVLTLMFISVITPYSAIVAWTIPVAMLIVSVASAAQLWPRTGNAEPRWILW